jgi:hypothetical protein
MKKIVLVLLAMVMLIAVPCMAFDGYDGDHAGQIPLCQNNKTGKFRFAPMKDIDPTLKGTNYEPYCSKTSPSETLIWINIQGLKGDKGDKGDPGPMGPNSVVAMYPVHQVLDTFIVSDFVGDPILIQLGQGQRVLASIQMTYANDYENQFEYGICGRQVGDLDPPENFSAYQSSTPRYWVPASDIGTVTAMLANKELTPDVQWEIGFCAWGLLPNSMRVLGIDGFVVVVQGQ